jgi:predicted PurR-regulated permease PerM
MPASLLSTVPIMKNTALISQGAVSYCIACADTVPAMQIVMGTFIVAFIGNGFVASAQNSTALKILDSKPMLRRRLLVLLYFSGIVSVVFLFGVMTIPDIVREGADFVRRLKSENVWVVVLEKMRNGLG